MKVYINSQGSSTTRWECRNSTRQNQGLKYLRQNWSNSSSSTLEGAYRHSATLRRTNAERSLLNKKRVIKMLFAVVLEFFICWAPLYTINTITLFDPSIVYNNLGYTAITFFHLLAYTSSCCNPITYCFMNCAFRKSFLNLFRCLRKCSEEKGFAMNGSEIHMDTKWINKCTENG